MINIEDVTTPGYSHNNNKEVTTPKHTVAPVSAQQLSSSAPPTKHLSGTMCPRRSAQFYIVKYKLGHYWTHGILSFYDYDKSS